MKEIFSNSDGVIIEVNEKLSKIGRPHYFIRRGNRYLQPVVLQEGDPKQVGHNGFAPEAYLTMLEHHFANTTRPGSKEALERVQQALAALKNATGNT